MTSVIWCHLGERDRGRTAELLALNNPDRGVVSVAGVVDRYQNAGWFARDMLVALGKPSEALGNESHCVDPWTVVPLWFTAAAVEHLIVVDAQRLGAGRVADLIGFACETGLTLWLFTHDDLRGVWTTGLSDWPVDRFDWHDAERCLPRRAQPMSSPAAGPGYAFDELPASDLWTFRADCKRTMSTRSFAAVDHLFCHSATETAAWASSPRTRPELVERIQHLVSEHSTLGERLVALRGFQVGALRGGWHVGVAFDGFASYAGEHPGRVVHDSDERWRRLHRWWQPHRGAVCALVAAGMAPATVAALRLGDVHDDRVDTQQGVVNIPAPARGVVRAQRLARLAEGAAESDSFVVIGAAADAAAWVRDLVNDAVDAGAAIPIPGDGARQRWHNSKELTARLGLKLNHLGDRALLSPVNVEAAVHDTSGDGASCSPGVVDGRILARRRLEIGLTRRLVARASGVNESVISKLESGELPPLMRAKALLRYADALGLHPAEVFSGHPPPPEPVEPTHDATALGALLWSCEQAVPRSAVADALGWDSIRVNRAVEALDFQLRGAGLRLLAGPGELSVVAEAAAVPPREQVAAVVRRQHLRGAVSLHRVKLLLDIANGEFRSNRNANERTLMHLRFLERAQMIDYPVGSATPVLAHDVAFSLAI